MCNSHRMLNAVINKHDVRSLSCKQFVRMQSCGTCTSTNFVLIPSTSSYSTFIGVMVGLPDTPYAGGAFKFTLKVTNRFPFEPPEIRFITPMLHPCMHNNHCPCVDMLHDGWTPALSIYKVLTSLSSELFSVSRLQSKYAHMSGTNVAKCGVESIKLLVKSEAAFQDAAMRHTQTHSTSVRSILYDLCLPTIRFDHATKSCAENVLGNCR
jgi:ubiquitin-protein ligase